MDRGFIGHSHQHVFDFIIEALLLTLLVFSPLAFGARAAWSEEVVIVLSSAIVITFLIKLAFCHEVVFLWTWAYTPAIVFIFFVLFQIIPLPTNLVNFISPHTAELKANLLNDLPNSQILLKSTSISFYFHQTVHDLRLLLVLFFVFVVVVNVFTDAVRIKRLLKAISLVGASVALLALAQDIFGNGQIYWFVPTPSGDRSGPFVNHNHFGQYMNLSIGATIGCIAIRVHEDFTGRTVAFNTVVRYMMSSLSKILWMFILVMALCITAVFVSLSRSGIISLLMAGAIMLLLFLKNNKVSGHGWIMAIVAFLAFSCILGVGFDAIYDRLADLNDFGVYAHRWQTIKDLTAVCRQFPMFGTGFGTHAVIYPMYQKIVTTLLFAHAENEYVQLLEECGVLGLLIFILFAGIIIFRFTSILRVGNSAQRASVYGLGYGLLAVMIHSLCDYGQRVPANAILSVMFCGLLISMSQGLKGGHELRLRPFRGRSSFMMYAFVLTSVVGASMWSLKGANDARIAEHYWRQVLKMEEELVDKNWQGSNREYSDLIACAKSAVKYQPADKDYLYCLGVYRWYSMTKQDAYELDGIIGAEEKHACVYEIMEIFDRARMSCPTYGPSYSMQGKIEKFNLNDDRGAEKIKKGLQLAPYDPITCFLSARLDVAEGKIQECLPKFERAIQLESSLFEDVADIYIYYLNRPELAILAAGNDFGRLSCVLRMLEDMQYEDLVRQTREKMKNVLEDEVVKPGTNAESLINLAALYKHDGDYEKAISCYRRALNLDYAQVRWRLKLARLLAATGRVEDAIDEMRICLRIKPHLQEAEELLKELVVLPEFGNKKQAGLIFR